MTREAKRPGEEPFQILRCTIHGSGEERNGAFMNFTSPARRKLHKNSWGWPVRGSAAWIVIEFYSCVFAQYKEAVDANSKLFKETDDEGLSKNTYEIQFCDLSSAPPQSWWQYSVLFLLWRHRHSALAWLYKLSNWKCKFIDRHWIFSPTFVLPNRSKWQVSFDFIKNHDIICS